MRNNVRRFMATILSLVMVFSLLPTMQTRVLGEEADPPEIVGTDTDVPEEPEEPLIPKTPRGPANNFYLTLEKVGGTWGLYRYRDGGRLSEFTDGAGTVWEIGVDAGNPTLRFMENFTFENTEITGLFLSGAGVANPTIQIDKGVEVNIISSGTSENRGIVTDGSLTTIDVADGAELNITLKASPNTSGYGLLTSNPSNGNINFSGNGTVNVTDITTGSIRTGIHATKKITLSDNININVNGFVVGVYAYEIEMSDTATMIAAAGSGGKSFVVKRDLLTGVRRIAASPESNPSSLPQMIAYSDMGMKNITLPGDSEGYHFKVQSLFALYVMLGAEKGPNGFGLEIKKDTDDDTWKLFKRDSDNSTTDEYTDGKDDTWEIDTDDGVPILRFIDNFSFETINRAAIFGDGKYQVEIADNVTVNIINSADATSYTEPSGIRFNSYECPLTVGENAELNIEVANAMGNGLYFSNAGIIKGSGKVNIKVPSNDNQAKGIFSGTNLTVAEDVTVDVSCDKGYGFYTQGGKLSISGTDGDTASITLRGGRSAAQFLGRTTKTDAVATGVIGAARNFDANPEPIPFSEVSDDNSNKGISFKVDFDKYSFYVDGTIAKCLFLGTARDTLPNYYLEFAEYNDEWNLYKRYDIKAVDDSDRTDGELVAYTEQADSWEVVSGAETPTLRFKDDFAFSNNGQPYTLALRGSCKLEIADEKEVTFENRWSPAKESRFAVRIEKPGTVVIDIGEGAVLNAKCGGTDKTTSSKGFFVASKAVNVMGKGEFRATSEIPQSSSAIGAELNANSRLNFSGDVKAYLSGTGKGASVANTTGITLKDNAELTASGTDGGLYLAGNRPTGVNSIAADKDKEPSTLPTPIAFAEVGADNSTTGIAFNTTDKQYRVDNQKAQYVYLSAKPAAVDYYLQFAKISDVPTLVKSSDSSPYPGKGTTWDTDGDTLILKDGFAFASAEQEYALKLMYNGAKIKIDDEATVSLSAKTTSGVAAVVACDRNSDLTLTVGEDAKLSLSADCKAPAPTAKAYGIRNPERKIALDIKDGATLAINVKGDANTSAIGISADVHLSASTYSLGDNALLDINTDGSVGDAAKFARGIESCYATFSGSGNVKIKITSPHECALYCKSALTLSDTVNLSVGGGSLEGVSTSNLNLSGKAVLLAKGATSGIAATNVQGAEFISVSKDQNPVPAPATLKYSVVNDGTSGITKNNAGYKIGDDVAKYVRLAASAPENYSLYFKQVSGTWNLYKGDTTTLYDGQASNWAVSGSTLTLKDGFEFASSTNYALIIAGDGNLEVPNNATVVLETTAGIGQQVVIYGRGTHTITVGANALLEAKTGAPPAGVTFGISTAGALTLSGFGEITATASAHSLSSPYDGEGISVATVLTLNQDIIVNAKGVGYGVESQRIVINNNAALTAMGETAGILVAQKPSTPKTIAYDTSLSNPNPLPIPVDYGNVKTDTSGLAYSTVRDVFEYDNEAAKYVRLAGDGTPGYFLNFKQVGGTWKLMKTAGDGFTDIGEYTEQSGFSINQNGTLTFTDHFAFQTTERHALVITKDATLSVSDGKTLSLSIIGDFPQSTPMGTLVTEGSATIQVGEGAVIDVNADTTVERRLYGVFARNTEQLDIKGKGEIRAVVGANSPNATGAGFYSDMGQVTVSEDVTITAESDGKGLAIQKLVLSDNATVIGKGTDIGIGATQKPTSPNAIAVSLQKSPSPEPALRDYSIVDNGSDITFDQSTYGYKLNGTSAQYVKLSAKKRSPAITTSSMNGGTVGTAYRQAIAATGTMPITFSVESGSLPQGMSLSNTGVIEGTPTTAGSYTFTVKATNDAGSDSKRFTIEITVNNTPPVITTPLLAAGVAGHAYSQTLSATGTAPITWSITSGTLPFGLTLDQATGAITGTPLSEGTTRLVITATNMAGSDSKTFVLTITADPAPPVITTTAVYSGVVGSQFSQILQATGTAPITWAVSAGSLPAGLQLNPTTGELAGNPATAGTETFTVTATNIAGASSQQFTMRIETAAVPPAITTASLPGGYAGDVYIQLLSATGTSPITWAISAGALPAGIRLDSVTGEIAGTPAAPGTFIFTVTATNAAGIDSEQFTIQITPTQVAPRITTENLHGGVTGTPYSMVLSATGTSPITWSISADSLPQGLTLNPASGLISGTPTTAGTTRVSITANNVVGLDEKQYTITITAAAVAPGITTDDIPNGKTGQPYNATFQATGTGPITWSVSGGTLPDGLRLNPATGVISGTPTTSETVTFTIMAQNSAGSATKKITVTIKETADAMPDIQTTRLKNGTAGKAYSDNLVAKGEQPITWSILSGSKLPAGLSLNPATGEISGTPTVTGDFSFTVEAVNFFGKDVGSISITIAADNKGGGGGGAPLKDTDPSKADQEAIKDGEALVIIDDKTYDAGVLVVDQANNSTSVVVDQKTIEAKIESAERYVEVIVPSETDKSSAQLILRNFEDMDKRDIVFSVVANSITYRLHASALDSAAILSALGATNSEDVAITFNISKAIGADDMAGVQEAIVSNAGELIIPPMEFTVFASFGGVTMEIKDFHKYVTRIIELTAEQAARITTAVVVEADGSLRHVPTNIYQSDGKWYGAISSMSNSVYAMIYNHKAFADTKGKWYENNVTEMASRKVLSGVSNDTFAGDRNVTRAEFAAIVTRALGLPEKEVDTFSDVEPSDWYFGAVGAAGTYNIVNGYSDGNRFAPNAAITRQEAMAIIMNSSKLLGFDGSMGDIEAFSDNGNIAPWAKEAVRFNVGSGLIVGDNGALRPTSNITRGETAAIVMRLLQKSGMID